MQGTYLFHEISPTDELPIHRDTHTDIYRIHIKETHTRYTYRHTYRHTQDTHTDTHTDTHKIHIQDAHTGYT